MSAKKMACYGLLVVYLAFLVSAFSFVMFRARAHFLPWAPLHFVYGMMAPYQGFATHNTEFVASGQLPGGTWEDVDLEEYFPVSAGERILRLHLIAHAARGDDIRRQKFAQVATQLLSHERKAGKAYVKLRLSSERWYMSPLGFFYNRIDPLIIRDFLTEVPQ